MPKSIRKEIDKSLLYLCVKRNNSYLRTSIPSEFIKERKIIEDDVLIIPKNQIKIGRNKLEVLE